MTTFKPIVYIVIGIMIGVGIMTTTGFTGSGASTDSQMLIANDGGGAYFFDGRTLYFLSGSNQVRVNDVTPKGPLGLR